MKLFSWRMMAAAILALVAGCHNGGHNANTAQVRLLNAVGDAEPLNLLIDGNVKATGVALGSTSSYAQIDNGTRTTDLVSSVNGATLYDKQLGYNDGGNYTLAAFGKRASISVIQLNDDTQDAQSGKFRLRFADFAPDIGAVDLYVVTGDISAIPPTLTGISGGTVTDYTEIAAGTYSFVLTTAGTKEILFQSPAQQIAANAKLTFAAIPALGAKLTNAALLQASGTTFMTNSLARVKAINAIPDAAGITFKTDNTTLLVGVPYTGSSSYVTTPSGSHTLKAELTTVPGTAIASLTRTLDPARDYTVASVGTVSSPALVAFADDNTLPSAGLAKIRFGNLTADGTAADALINFATRATGLASRTVSDYYQVAPATDYTLTFSTPGGVTVLVSLSNVELDAGAIYTAYLLGTSSSRTLKLVRDR
jgi:hypothetical protein